MSSRSKKKRWGLLTFACSIILLVLLVSKCPTARADEPLPVADFTTSSTFVMVGQSIQFTYTGTQGAGIAVYNWNPGDGTGILNGESPVHAYNSPGQYSITLTVVDLHGNSSTITKASLLYVQPFPYRPWSNEEEEDQPGLFVFLLVGVIVSVAAGVVTTIASVVMSYRERRRVSWVRARQVPESEPSAKPAHTFVEPNADAPVHQG
jgi:PKD repeat protein